MNKYFKILDDFYLAQVKLLKPLTPFFVGERGSGKTQTIRDWAKSNKLGLFLLNLESIDSSDFTGLPYIDDGVQKWSRPEFMAIKNSVLFLDEMNRVRDHDVKTALHTLLIDREINGHKLDDSVLIVGAGNNFNDDNYDTIEFDASLADRIVQFKFSYTTAEWLQYIQDIGKSNNDLYMFWLSQSDTINKQSHRRLTKLLDLVVLTGNSDYIKEFINIEHFMLFRQYKSGNLINLDDVLEGKVPEKIDAIASVRVFTQFLEEYKKLDAKNMKNLNKFLVKSPKELVERFFNNANSILVNVVKENSRDSADKLGKFWRENGLWKDLENSLDSRKELKRLHGV